MTERKPIICLGIMVADVIGRPLRTLPGPGRLVLVDEMELHLGGCAVNTTTALARLGTPVEIIGKVGFDPLGDFVLQQLEEQGIGVQNVSRDPRAGTSATMVMVDPDGERRFVHYLGANAHLTLNDIDVSVIESAEILHVAGALVMPGLDGEPTAELMQRAKTAGVTTFLDVVWDDTGRWMELLGPCLLHTDYFIPNVAEAQALLGLEMEEPENIAHALLSHGVGTVVLKLGADGCLLMTNTGQAMHFPAFEVNVVDATGAGDAFAAGFITGVWQGWSLERTAQFANAVGGLCVTGLGAAGGVCSLSETLAFIDSQNKVDV